VAGQPSSDATVAYFVSNKDSQIVAQGSATSDGVGKFKFDLPAADTEKLTPGPNQLKIFASSNEARRFVISTNTILATSTPSGNPEDNKTRIDPTLPPQQPSGCLIATAAFGSELTPQVQYLRNFRENYILSTSSGAAFMNAFNSVYYSFSPQVADYERGQPWLQSAVKAGLYPLFGILMVSERAHFIASGEIGSIISGSLASMLIGAVYLWPAGLSARVQNRFSVATKISLLTLGAALAMTFLGLVAGSSFLLTFSTPLIVLSIAAASALVAGRVVRRAVSRITAGKY
jgi:peptide/nickel transport system substrate-binding protein